MSEKQNNRSLWFILAAIGLFSLWYVATKRTQNPLWLLMAAFCFFVLAYGLYGTFVAGRVWGVREEAAGDGDEGQRWAVLGYHFAAIAGAGALIAPVAVVQYGFLPGVLWVLVGACLAGAVHDFVVLLAGVRRDGRSLPQIARGELGAIAAPALAVLLLLTLLAVLSAVATALVNLLAGNAGATYALALTVPMALFVTFYARVLRPGRGGEAVVIGLAFFTLAVVAGTRAGSTGFMSLFLLSERSLIVLLAIYCLIAALVPIGALSLVRGALSGYLILVAMGLIAVAVAFAAPPLQVAPTTAFVRGGGPLLTGGVFPTVVIVLTAGAVSGFHALIASGPTARLLRREGQALPVGFGAMLLVGFLALLVLAVTATLSPADFMAINTGLPPERIAEAVGTSPPNINQLRDQLGQVVAAKPGGPVTLAVGIVQVLKTLPKVKPTWLPFLYQAVNVLAALVLFSTLESGVRAVWLLIREWSFGPLQATGLLGALGRLPPLRLKAGDWLSVTVEWSKVFGRLHKPKAPDQERPLGRTGLGGLLVILVVIVVWAVLTLSVYPRFTDPLVGVSSLLLASVILCLGTALVMRLHSGRARLLALVTLIPALVILLIGLAGGVLSVRELWTQASTQQAFMTAYKELPILATQQELIPIERAWTIVREMSVDQASEVFTSGGRDGLAEGLSARFGDSVPEEGVTLANLVVGRARALALWSGIQVAGIVSAMALTLMLVGRSANRWVALLRDTS
jgi:carbon starvation protein